MAQRSATGLEFCLVCVRFSITVKLNKALHKAIARSRQTVADGVRCLDLERMGAQVEVFSQALELDLIDPDDF